MSAPVAESKQVLVVASDSTFVLNYLNWWSGDVVIGVADEAEVKLPDSAADFAPERIALVTTSLSAARTRNLVEVLANRWPGVEISLIAGPNSADAATWQAAFAGLDSFEPSVVGEPGVHLRLSPSQDHSLGRGELAGQLFGALLLGAGSTKPAAKATEKPKPAKTTTAPAAQPAKKSGKKKPKPSRSARIKQVIARRKKLLLLAAVAGIGAIAFGAVTAHFGHDAVLGAALAAVVLLVLASAVRAEQHNRRIHARLRELDRRTKRVSGQQLPKLIDSVEVVREGSKHIRATAQAVAVSRLTQVDLVETVKRLDRDTRNWRRRDFEQLQATVNLFTALPMQAGVPPMRGWAASPDFALVLVDEVLRKRPKLIVELGSGVSTLWLARAAQSAGLSTKIISLDHNESYAQKTRELLAAHGLAEFAEIRVAPLTEVETPRGPMTWYSAEAVTDLTEIDLVVVDGPPAATGPLARYPALPVLAERLSANVSVILDDTCRADEQEVMDLWLGWLPGLERTDLPTEKGTSILVRGDQA